MSVGRTRKNLLKPNLSQAIQWLNVSYAAYHNRKHRRSGHLFQGRFKSVLVDADEYLKHLSRYIHLKPGPSKNSAKARRISLQQLPCFYW